MNIDARMQDKTEYENQFCLSGKIWLKRRVDDSVLAECILIIIMEKKKRGRI